MDSSNQPEMSLPFRSAPTTNNPPASAAMPHNYSISTTPGLECTNCQARRWLDCDKATQPTLCTPCREFGGDCHTSRQSMNDAMFKQAAAHKLFGDVNPPTPRSGEGAKPPKRVEDEKLPPGWQGSHIDLLNPPALSDQVMFDPMSVLQVPGQQGGGSRA
ncbi:hypothetical protein PRZ48_008734 [Zasmidium cellare]|uniref:Zn(2)-C6 fungal-type domain-containing protein n=1 Tax=Zasmidium cellare TaxID=395010 RepID=A0ABR0EGY4_ZASCE|nr:hypothetical protein PRZ48_008734 [Zasmidium cellare]